MAKLEEVARDGVLADFYLEDVSTKQFMVDVRELMIAYTDSGVIDRAVELLESCKTKGEYR